jgi:ubiquinone/menaquinone biosynthesis C-methylase UbiE
MTKDEFDSFFKGYATNVDNANKQNFWKLSDAITFAIIKEHIPDPGAGGLILDAGGGTARWAIQLSDKYESRFCVYDLSADMIARARENIATANLSERIEIKEGDLTDMSAIPDESVDHIVSIYSPISFVDDTTTAVAELHRILKPKGRILIMGHGHSNAIASKINNYHACAAEISKLHDSFRVKWADGVPELNTFSKESMETLLSKVGFLPVATFGVPVFVQPGSEDFDPENRLTSGVSKALEDESFFRTIFDIEMEHNAEATIANRGVNIFALAEKA